MFVRGVQPVGYNSSPSRICSISYARWSRVVRYIYLLDDLTNVTRAVVSNVALAYVLFTVFPMVSKEYFQSGRRAPVVSGLCLQVSLPTAHSCSFIVCTNVFMERKSVQIGLTAAPQNFLLFPSFHQKIQTEFCSP
jgi:hypothetical protein